MIVVRTTYQAYSGGDMRKLLLRFFLLSVFSSTCLSAQSLVGTWVSKESVLVSLKFSLTFYEHDYLISDSLGQTIGTYYCTSDKIYFTPTKVGIKGGDIGKNDTWDYSFIDEDSFYMSSGSIKVKLVRVGSKEWAQTPPSEAPATPHGR